MSKIEVITSVERRRKWSDNEKEEIVKEANEEGANLSAIARKYKIEPNQIYTWKKQFSGQLPMQLDAPEIDLLKQRIKTLEMIIGRKTVEIEYYRDEF